MMAAHTAAGSPAVHHELGPHSVESGGTTNLARDMYCRSLSLWAVEGSHCSTSAMAIDVATSSLLAKCACKSGYVPTCFMFV